MSAKCSENTHTFKVKFFLWFSLFFFLLGVANQIENKFENNFHLEIQHNKSLLTKITQFFQITYFVFIQMLAN